MFTPAEYLHFYINSCLCESHLVMADRRVVRQDGYPKFDKRKYVRFVQGHVRVKLVLKKTEDLTKTDFEQLAKIDGLKNFELTQWSSEGNFLQIEYKRNNEIYCLHWLLPRISPLMTVYLLRRGYDIFALIDENKAIAHKSILSSLWETRKKEIE